MPSTRIFGGRSLKSVSGRSLIFLQKIKTSSDHICRLFVWALFFVPVVLLEEIYIERCTCSFHVKMIACSLKLFFSSFHDSDCSSIHYCFQVSRTFTEMQLPVVRVKNSSNNWIEVYWNVLCSSLSFNLFFYQLHLCFGQVMLQWRSPLCRW